MIGLRAAVSKTKQHVELGNIHCERWTPRQLNMGMQMVKIGRRRLYMETVSIGIPTDKISTTSGKVATWGIQCETRYSHEG